MIDQINQQGHQPTQRVMPAQKFGLRVEYGNESRRDTKIVTVIDAYSTENGELILTHPNGTTSMYNRHAWFVAEPVGVDDVSD